MIPSGHLTTDRGGSARRHSARLAMVDTRRRSAEDAVGVLLEVWRSSTTMPQEVAWDEMDEAAGAAIDALAALLAAIDLVREEAEVSSVPAPRPAP